MLKIVFYQKICDKHCKKPKNYDNCDIGLSHKTLTQL